MNAISRKFELPSEEELKRLTARNFANSRADNRELLEMLRRLERIGSSQDRNKSDNAGRSRKIIS